MRRTVTAVETVEGDDVARLERHGWKPVVRWERLAEAGEGVFTCAEALRSVRMHELRSARRRVVVR